MAPPPMGALPESETESGTEGDEVYFKEELPKQSQKSLPSTGVELESETVSESESDDSTNKLRAKEDDTHKISQKRQLGEVQNNSVDSTRDTKKLKGNFKVAADDSSKKPFDRVWSEDDELILLKGMLEYSSVNVLQTSMDLKDFHCFIKKSIHFDVSRQQVTDKIRRLRCKYEKYAAKIKVGVHPKFKRPIEEELFQLSKKIWTDKEFNGKVEAEGGIEYGETRAANIDLPFCFRGLTQVIKSLGIICMDEYTVKRGLELMDSINREDLAKKWEKVLEIEMTLALKKSEVALEISRVISNVFASSS